MDLSQCKLICKSRIKIKEKTKEEGFWSSSNYSRINQDRVKSTNSPKLTTSKSAPRINSMLNLSSLKSSTPTLRDSPNKRSNVILPSIEVNEHQRFLLRPKGLITIKRISPGEEKSDEVKPILWNQPLSRLGFSGAKFSNYIAKSPTRQIKKKKIINSEKKEEVDLDKMEIEYKEPYLQYILEKKRKAN